MTKVHDEVLAANKAYAASFGRKGELALPPARQFAILTCMDARLDPARYAGLSEGDAHVVRNAGGRAIKPSHLRVCVKSRTTLSQWFSQDSAPARWARWSAIRAKPARAANGRATDERQPN